MIIPLTLSSTLQNLYKQLFLINYATPAKSDLFSILKTEMILHAFFALLMPGLLNRLVAGQNQLPGFKPELTGWNTLPQFWPLYSGFQYVFELIFNYFYIAKRYDSLCFGLFFCSPDNSICLFHCFDTFSITLWFREQ